MTRIFISHSHSDEAIARKLVNFLLTALELKRREILCTSNPDQGLKLCSTSITDQLKNNLKNSEALIILITADSLYSAWIPFEAGSFWTTDKPIIPILGPGLTQDDLPGPLRNLLSIPIEAQDLEDQLNEATNQIAKKLNLQQEWIRERKYTLKEFSDALRAWQSRRPVPNPSQQEEIEHLKAQIQEFERSHNQQLKEIEAASQIQKQTLEAAYQTEIAEKETEINRLQKKIEQLQLQVLVELKSAKGVDYTKLKEFLAAGNWKDADEETAKRMLEVANRQTERWLDVEDIDNFPCEDLHTIDQLWVKYSNGRFGFSVQKNIYNGNREFNEEVWEEFANQVGWHRGKRWLDYSELTFELVDTTRKGHLPVVRGGNGQDCVLHQHWVLLSRVDL